MDRNKQIEEMAKVMAENWFNETIISTAERLINAGYRKLPKDSVALSREEYEKLKTLASNKCNYDCDLVDMPDFEREKKLIEKLKRAEAEKDRLYEMKLDLENQLIEKGWTDYEGANEIENS